MKTLTIPRALLFVLALLICMPAVAQQEYVPRYEVYTGFAYLTTPELNLNQRGFIGSFAVNLKPWVAIAAGCTAVTGSTGLTPGQTKLGPPLAPFIPPGTSINVPLDAHTFTFAAGPHFSWRRLKPVTFFLHPGFGLYHSSVDLKVPPSVNALIVLTGRPPIPANLSDTTYFYGMGGGFEVNASKHVGLRISVDWARTHVFRNLLDQQNNIRFSVGPTWRWGELQD